MVTLASLCPLLGAAGVIWFLWRITRPWDERGRPLLSFRRPPAEVRHEEPATVAGYTRLHPQVDFEADLSGWQATPRETNARFVIRDGEVTMERLATPVDEGARAFVSADGLTLIAEPLPAGVELAELEAHATATRGTADARVRVLEGRGGLQFAVGGGRALVLGFSRRAPRGEVVVDSLRLPNATADAPSLELRLVGDAHLAALVEKKKSAAFETLAPGLHLVFVKKSHRDAATFELLAPSEVAELGGREAFLEKMRAVIDPSTVKLEGDDDLVTNEEFSPHACTLIAQPALFERLRAKLGDAVLVGVPSISRLLLARDTPRAREALAAMLQAAPAVETTLLVSSRVYRVTGPDWRAWSVVDQRN